MPRMRVVVPSTVLAAVLMLLAATALSPWPGVWLIRAVFDRGAAAASARLEKHVPDGIVTDPALRYDAEDPAALLDIHRPAQPNPAAPTVVWIHGGGFVSGRRSDVTNYLKVLAGRGFVVVNVDYTLAPEARYPTPVRQVTRALAFLDREAGVLGVNRDALVLAGDSAGAQIAAQVANLIRSPAYAQAMGVAAPMRAEQLRGALLHCGVYDVGRLGEGQGGVLGSFLRTVTWAYGGRRNWRDVPGFERVSVSNFVTADFPPSFISAGNADPLLPQSVRMAAALREAGVRVESLFFPANHPRRLGHEYQFDLDTAEGRQALEQSIAWLGRLGE